ncbi:DUF4946 domain-containing protein [Xanthobacteraceae bacterium A53D]
MFAKTRNCAVALALGSALLVSSAAGAQEAKVKWPEGWESTLRPFQSREADGSIAKGLQAIGVKKGADAQPQGIIFILTLTRAEPLPAPSLKAEAEELRNKQFSDGGKAGRKTTCGDLSPTTVDSMPAMQMPCTTVEDGKPELQQSVILTVKNRDIVTLIFTAPKAHYDTTKADFDAVAKSVKL